MYIYICEISIDLYICVCDVPESLPATMVAFHVQALLLHCLIIIGGLSNKASNTKNQLPTPCPANASHSS